MKNMVSWRAFEAIRRLVGEGMVGRVAGLGEGRMLGSKDIQ